jgi:hypothetical protein
MLHIHHLSLKLILNYRAGHKVKVPLSIYIRPKTFRHSKDIRTMQGALPIKVKLSGKQKVHARKDYRTRKKFLAQKGLSVYQKLIFLIISIQMIIFKQEYGIAGLRFGVVTCDAAVAYLIAVAGVT